MASKETKFSSTWRYFLKTTFWGGLAGGLSMATGEIWLGYNFHDSDYFFPFIGSAILASSVNGLDSVYRLWKSLSVSRAFKRPTYAAVPLYNPDQPGRRVTGKPGHLTQEVNRYVKQDHFNTTSNPQASPAPGHTRSPILHSFYNRTAAARSAHVGSAGQPGTKYHCGLSQRR